MRCSNCKTENPAGKKFCGDCGAALANICPQCSADNPAGKRFCGEGGTALQALAAATAPAKQSHDPPIPGEETPAPEEPDAAGKTGTALLRVSDGQTTPLAGV